MDKLAKFDSSVLHWLLSLGDPEVVIGQHTFNVCIVIITEAWRHSADLVDTCPGCGKFCAGYSKPQWTARSLLCSGVVEHPKVKKKKFLSVSLPLPLHKIKWTFFLLQFEAP